MAYADNRSDYPCCLFGLTVRANKEINNMKHTPTPWKLEHHNDTGTFLVDGKCGFLQIARISTWGERLDEPTRLESKANAAFIIKACNSHDALCAALNDAALMFNDIAKNLDPDSDEHAWAIDGRDNAREALRLAGEDV